MQFFDKKHSNSTLAFILILLLMIVISLMYFYNIFRWRNYPDFGYGFRSATGVKIVGLTTANGEKAGLRVGDEIIEINSESYNTIEELRLHMNRELGGKNTYLIERRGQRFAVTVKNIPTGFKGSFARSGFSYLLGLCYMAIGLLVFLMKPHQRSSWIFFLFTSIFGLFLTFIYQLGPTVPLLLENFNMIGYCFTPAVFIHLALSFPEERKLLNRHPYLQLAPHVISLILFVLIRSATPVMAYAPKHWRIIAVVYMAFGVLFFLISCLQLRLTSTSQMVKMRASMILLGFGISASLPIVDLVINAFFQIYIFPNFNYYLPFFVVFPAFLGYSIVKHDLFDIDAIIKRTYGYVLTTGAIAGMYGLFVLVSNLTFGSFEFARSPAFTLIFLLAIVFLFNPIRNRVQRFIDLVFYRLEYNYRETVQKISESTRTLLGLNEIGQSIVATAMGTLFVDSGYVMLQRKKDDAYRCLIRAGEKDIAFARTATEDSKPADAAETSPDAGQAGKPTAATLVMDYGDGVDQTAITESGVSPTEIVLPLDEPFIKLLAQYQKEVTIYDIQEDPFFANQRDSCRQIFDNMDATLIVPLIHEKNLIGMICLGRKKSGKFYRREDINLLNILANQGAIAIENALMLEEVIEKERMEEELNIAKDLQVSMLPLECPQIEGFEIAAFSESAREVGGDFYDFIEISDDQMGLVIGDVTGKSVSGALVMAASRSIFRMLGEEKLTVSESMIRANRRTKRDIKTGMFVALLYAVLGSADKSLTLCSAGQTLPVFRSAASGETKLVETEGDSFPLGILEDAAYEETRLKLEAGDRIVLYTDGIVEAMNEQEELFGFDRLLEVIRKSPAETAETLLEEIKGHVNDFAGTAAQHDDITIIVVQAT